MTPDQRTAILAAESRSAALRVELAKLRTALTASNREVARLYRDARRVVHVRHEFTSEKILRVMTARPRSRFTAQGLQRETGASFISVQNTLGRLVRRGLVVRLELGVYGPAVRDVAAE